MHSSFRTRRGKRYPDYLREHDGLESLIIDTVKLGSKEVPLKVTSHDLKSVEITTSEGCWLHLGDTSPLGKTLVLNTKGPLHVGTEVSRQLRWFDLDSPSSSSVGEGSSSLQWQLAEAMYTWCAKTQNNPNMEDDIADDDNAAGAADADVGADDDAAACCCLILAPCFVGCVFGVLLALPAL